MRKHILIVDDEPSIRKVLAAHLRRDGHEVTPLPSATEAVATLKEQPADLVITDLRMPGMDGMALLEWCTCEQPGLPVVIITAHGTVDSAVAALKKGAADYITKPFDKDELKIVVEKALAQEAHNRQTVGPQHHGMVGNTPGMQQIAALIDKVANSPTTVLVTGESGTGKELVARALHAGSSRAQQPFIIVNCGAIPQSLVESELFGHEKGAFTGAVTTRPGRFELADGGTLFLDEVAELSKEMQVSLLRVLQQQSFERVGGLKTIEVDVRLIAATNQDLSSMVQAGEFREDLFYRLNVVPIHLPPLRERTNDIPSLAQHFLERFNDRLEKSIRELTPGALAVLKSQRWPGNVRELENAMERAVLLADGDTLTAQDFGVGHDPEVQTDDEMGLKEYVRVHTAMLERQRIKKALEAMGGNVTRAAKTLGISRKGLQLKMKEYGLRE